MNASPTVPTAPTAVMAEDEPVLAQALQRELQSGDARDNTPKDALVAFHSGAHPQLHVFEELAARLADASCDRRSRRDSASLIAAS